MNKFLILVEGKADATFLRDYLTYLFKLETIKQLKKSIELQNDEIFIEILIAEGYSAILNLKSRIEDYFFVKEYKILVIQDADNPKKQDGGVTNRNVYLNKVKEELKINFDFFLFPNNKDDGDLENLLLKIVNRELFIKTKDCYLKWIECSKEYSPEEHIKELFDNKHIVYNYFRTFYGMDNAKEEKRRYTDEFWQFSNKNLEPLKTFFEEIIKK